MGWAITPTSWLFKPTETVWKLIRSAFFSDKLFTTLVRFYCRNHIGFLTLRNVILWLVKTLVLGAAVHVHRASPCLSDDLFYRIFISWLYEQFLCLVFLDHVLNTVFFSLIIHVFSYKVLHLTSIWSVCECWITPIIQLRFDCFTRLLPWLSGRLIEIKWLIILVQIDLQILKRIILFLNKTFFECLFISLALFSVLNWIIAFVEVIIYVHIYDWVVITYKVYVRTSYRWVKRWCTCKRILLFPWVLLRSMGLWIHF